MSQTFDIDYDMGVGSIVNLGVTILMGVCNCLFSGAFNRC